MEEVTGSYWSEELLQTYQLFSVDHLENKTELHINTMENKYEEKRNVLKNPKVMLTLTRYTETHSHIYIMTQNKFTNSG